MLTCYSKMDFTCCCREKYLPCKQGYLTLCARALDYCKVASSSGRLVARLCSSFAHQLESPASESPTAKKSSSRISHSKIVQYHNLPQQKSPAVESPTSKQSSGRLSHTKNVPYFQFLEFCFIQRLDFFGLGDFDTGLFCCGRLCHWTFFLWDILLLDFFAVGDSTAGLFCCGRF